MLRDGLTNPQIAEQMGISLDGAKYHVAEIMGKLGAGSRQEAALTRIEEYRPWWAAALAPIGWFWRKMSVAAHPTPGGVATVAAAGLGIATVAGLGLIAFLLVRTINDGGSNSDMPPPGSAGGQAVDVRLDGDGGMGTATITPTTTGFDVVVEVGGPVEVMGPGTHASEIHQGDLCLNTPLAPPTAPVAEALTDIGVSATGSGINAEGTATTHVTSSQLGDFQHNNSYVAVHALDGSVILCGNIPAS